MATDINEPVYGVVYAISVAAVVRDCKAPEVLSIPIVGDHMPNSDNYALLGTNHSNCCYLNIEVTIKFKSITISKPEY